MPWIAFVPDISGVCSSVGTFEITSKPRKIASTSIVSSMTVSVARRSARPPPRARHAGAGDDLVVPVERAARRRARACCEQRGDVARVELARVRTASCAAGSSARRSSRRRSTTSSPGSVSSQLPPVSAARSTITEPGRIARTAAAVTSFGAGRPGIAAVVMTTSNSGIRCLERGLLRGLLLAASAPARSRPRSPRRRRRDRGTSRRATRPARRPPGGRRTPTRPRRAGARSRSPAGPRRPRRSRAPSPAATVPAAVISIGKNSRSRSAASSTAL